MLIREKPKTEWEKRKNKVLHIVRLFKKSKAGLIGISILIIFMLMAILSRYVP